MNRIFDIDEAPAMWESSPWREPASRAIGDILDEKIAGSFIDPGNAYDNG